MDFQLLDADYTYIGNRPVVRLYGRDGSGKSVCCFAPKFEPYFFVKPDNPVDVAAHLKNRFREIDRIEHLEMFEPVGYSRTPSKMLRVVTSEPKGVAAIRDEVRHTPGVLGIYETDILFANRFMIDHGLAGMGWVRAEEASGADMPVDCSRKFTAGRVEPVATLANAQLRYLSFDIECLPLNGGMPVPEKSPIIMMSLAFEPSYGALGTLVLVGKKAAVSGEVEAFNSETDMLRRFFEIIRDYDPDVITGYNINGFDVPYIIDRLSALKGDINDRIGRDGRAASYRKIGAFPQVSVTGRVVADAMLLMKRDFSLKQYSLKFTAKEFLGMEKLDVAPLEMESHWNDSGERFLKLIEYARRDAVLALQFMRKLRLLDKYIALARASGVLLQDVLDGGQSAMVESILLREFRKQNRVVPPRPDSGITDTRDEENEELKGGEVLEPKRGLLENVVVLDYKSLYPTIMMAHNLCYTTVVTGDEPPEAETAPSGGRFAAARVKKGIVPAILERLLSERVETRKRMKAAAGEEYRVLDATQLALKILLNSFYGYSGYARARLYSLTLANAVTSFGRENILNTKSLIEGIGGIQFEDGRNAGLSVIYGDTDSVFVELSCERVAYEDAEYVGKKIAETVSKKLPQPMELVFESFARRVIFIAKKRYAMWSFEKKGEGKIKVKGMETVRRDWCGLTSKTVDRVLELILKKGQVDEAVRYVKEVIKRVRSIDVKSDSELFNDLILTRQYTKKTMSYKSRQPHITVVEKLAARGAPPNIGDRIPFVILSGNGLFVDRAEDPEYARAHDRSLDIDYYVKKQVLPPVERVLAGFGVSAGVLESRVLGEICQKKEAEQRKLFEF